MDRKSVGAGASVKVAILGFGTVGTSAARILCEHPPQGVALGCIFNRGIDRKRVPWIPSSVLWTENFDQVLASQPDIVVELAGGLNPAGEWVRRSLAAGKSVVTANKKMIAEQGPALEELARRHGCQLLYGAAVAGGVPVIPAVQQGLAGDRINRFHGILNGTCNFILSNMEDGAEFDPTLREAQERGYAEANPTEDVDGFDARAKLVILSRIGLRVEVLPEEVACRTIRDVSAIDFAYAKELNCTIRQIARAEVRNQELLATVGPMLVPRSSPLSWSRGTENMVISGGQYGGETVFSGHGAGGHPRHLGCAGDCAWRLSRDHCQYPGPCRRRFCRAALHQVCGRRPARHRGSDRGGPCWAAHQYQRHLAKARLSERSPAVCGHRRTLQEFSIEGSASPNRADGLYAGAPI
jgi:homoserine dehydrogenase